MIIFQVDFPLKERFVPYILSYFLKGSNMFQPSTFQCKLAVGFGDGELQRSKSHPFKKKEKNIPLKINMEHKNEGLVHIISLFKQVIFRSTVNFCRTQADLSTNRLLSVPSPHRKISDGGVGCKDLYHVFIIS